MTSSDLKKGTANSSLLGRETPYCNIYSPDLLFPIPRQEKRFELGIDEQALPFNGLDIWTAFEVSWLNPKGRPEVRIADFAFQATSANLIESKSFKLYLNSFNGSRFASEEEVIEVMEKDLSAASGEAVTVDFRKLGGHELLFGDLPGENLDDLDIEVSDYTVKPSLLKVEDELVELEEVNSHLLKSNCLVTSQPDWGSIVIRYSGQRINREGLLKYIISFREHNEFHEQCVERVFSDIMQRCAPTELTVYARYVRRGGLDINPYRSNFEDEFDISRTLRQ
ncbi:NADPH-dependent 7-cyano-7-deazaguanine reductase QueF [Thiomicrorhabdus heinhorstiae]|uniref:NADPH-dependent 7-cyano-7-deazaguanine reductase n=1 Tax=Thiomicrorhabdus heinhorstiae TaxID=2748010 RepID=A0ABS0BYC9_9GAMM|nr:NADPH-dependent 7-cyano-7-deazaguanine reductase QueF [Thiomicrorhabdus heinhorstiae]MBF6058803.1 NADPH-dependent 7-cyano-7-deazaguanine reductase QueF [Thiomicrorhabdus heinhorstiae]